MINKLLDSSRTTKQLISVSYDVVILVFAYVGAITLRIGKIPVLTSQEILVLALAIGLTIVTLVKLGLYRAILRFIDREAIIRITIGAVLSGVYLAILSAVFDSPAPRSIPIIYMFIAFFLISAPRLLMRDIYQLARKHTRQHVIIYGAGYTGSQLAIQLTTGTQYKPVAFIDNNQTLHGTTIQGIRIYPPSKIKMLVEQHAVSAILLALGNASHAQRKEIIESLEDIPAKIQTVPPIADILSGKAELQEIRNIDITDLLGREPIPAHPELISRCITGKVVMVTGAGGSIGAELCRQIMVNHPRILILLELNEFALYQIEQELTQRTGNSKTEIVSLLGSVQNRDRMEVIMRSYGVQTVYHAAAYKHVPLIEQNIIEGVRNNIFGTMHCAKAAIAAKVETFILVSTDKAVRPTNIMGATKRMAELTLQALQLEAEHTCFTMVRFGNVLGSSGSVVPLFQEQIKNGGPITVTHKNVIRYFMTIPEAAQLVVQAGSMAEGGEVFVLDMGKPVRIIDLARKMVHLSGLTEKTPDNPNGDIEISITGLRPGEKLYEELLTGNNPTQTSHPRIMMAKEAFLGWKATKNLLSRLDAACHDACCESIQRILLAAPTDFNAEHSLQDIIWRETSNNIAQSVPQMPSDTPDPRQSEKNIASTLSSLSRKTPDTTFH